MEAIKFRVSGFGEYITAATSAKPKWRFPKIRGLFKSCLQWLWLDRFVSRFRGLGFPKLRGAVMVVPIINRGFWGSPFFAETPRLSRGSKGFGLIILSSR